MNQQKSLTIWTLVANFFIVIAAGHGIATSGLLEIFVISNILGLDDAYSSGTLFESKLFYAAIANLLGQLLIIVALFSKSKLSTSLKFSGLFSLIAAFCFLLSFIWEEPTIILTIVTGIPFIVLSTLLGYRSIKSQYDIAEG